ncbi:acyl-CoA dehydrogenase family protein [Pannus brasiliensis CCIBt3594]|uniref:Acyl-CoA dehydrogenase family protein n=1 Tax=Pannus brasiliensis CCIBt3594 TaxID=1427578 RepID=A0AAW9R158_9CHRO
MTGSSALLTIARDYFENIVAPAAGEIDRSPVALREALRGMGDRSLLALKVPEKWGGNPLDAGDFPEFQILAARYSGALAFLQTQHQSAGGFLAAGHNEMLQRAYLPYLARGEKLVGVGFSQLRRSGEPPLRAFPVTGGYQLTGEVPWITGRGFFEAFIIGATLPDGRALYGLVPLADDAGIRFGEPMQLIALGVTNTVKATLNRYFLAEERVVKIESAAAIHENDRHNVLHHGFYSIGCALAGLDVLREVYRQKRTESIANALERLEEDVNLCRQKMRDASEASFEEKLFLRGRAIELAGLCARAAVIASGGAANSIDHPAGRVYREALMFSVSGQTLAVMEAGLERLLSRDGRCYT